MSDAYAVHPTLAIVPELPSDELQELADDIAENGLRHPIAVIERHGETIVVDGRARLAACEMAGVEPTIERLEIADDQIAAYVLSSTAYRRHLSKGQRAMLVVMLYPDREKGGRGKRGEKSVLRTALSVSAEMVSKALFVKTNTPKVVNAVALGTKELTAAYKEAKALKHKLEEAKRLKTEALARVLEQLILGCSSFGSAKLATDPEKWAADMAADLDPEFWPKLGPALTIDNVEKCGIGLTALAAEMRKQEAADDPAREAA